MVDGVSLIFDIGILWITARVSDSCFAESRYRPRWSSVSRLDTYVISGRNRPVLGQLACVAHT